MRKNQTYKHSNIRYNSLTHANQGFVVTSTCLCRAVRSVLIHVRLLWLVKLCSVRALEDGRTCAR